MQTLSRLSFQHHSRVRAVAAWLAIVAVLGALPGTVFARTSCAPRNAAACPACHRAEARAGARSEGASAACALAKKPCCGCEISSDPLPAAGGSALQLDRPASHGYGLVAAGATRIGVIAPPSASCFHAPGPPDAPPGRAASPTILRL